MKDISQEEFEAKVQDIIDGKLTRKQLTKDLETDTRTLNNKIQELLVTNETLYLAFIKRFPYRPKERKDIDYEALIIEIIKNGMTTADAAAKYEIGERTIRRKVKGIEKENPYLIEIYREVKKNNKNNIKFSKELEAKIEHLVSRTVKIGDINTARKKELEELETTFNHRCQYVSKEQAAQSMGLTANRMYKLLNELYRIKIEESHTKKISDNKSTFKDSLKVSSISDAECNTKEENTKKDIIRKEIGED